MKTEYIKRTDSGYPEILNNYERMPEGLYYIGNLPDKSKKSVSIVGSRSCSRYGSLEAEHFAEVIARADIQIISGMAIGIDSAAHRGALNAGGKTFAILGCGTDICYPPSNSRLYRKILESGGGIISEYPPGTPALAHHFPTRNRIISGLADAVIIIEARARSGSLITADFALEQGKDVYALPGRIHDPLSLGCLQLLSQGANPALSPEQVLAGLGMKNGTKKAALRADLSDDEKKLLEYLSEIPQDMSFLCAATGFESGRLSRILLDLSLKGLISDEGAGMYIKKFY